MSNQMNETDLQKESNQNDNNSNDKLNLQFDSKPIQNSTLRGSIYNDHDVKKIRMLFQKLGTTAVIVNRLDYYGNSIPIAALGNAFSFILHGFYICKVYSNNDTFLWSIILLFGGIMQLTGGFLEFLKGRSFPTVLYLTLGFYCLSLYICNTIPIELGNYKVFGLNNTDITLAFFYGSWMAIFLPIFVCSFRINVIYALQCIVTFAFFIVKCIGELFNIFSLIRHTSGILEVIAGFSSLYICLSQLINEQYGRQVLSTFRLSDDNEIDIIENYYETPN